MTAPLPALPDQPERDREPKHLAERDRAFAARLRYAALAVVGLVVLGVAWRMGDAPDPLAGPRPEVARVTQFPRVKATFDGWVARHKRVPHPAELTAALKKAGGPPIEVIGFKQRKPNAFRIGGTAAEPVLELLDERGEVAVYGDMPFIVDVAAPPVAKAPATKAPAPMPPGGRKK